MKICLFLKDIWLEDEIYRLMARKNRKQHKYGKKQNSVKENWNT